MKGSFNTSLDCQENYKWSKMLEQAINLLRALRARKVIGTGQSITKNRPTVKLLARSHDF